MQRALGTLNVIVNVCVIFSVGVISKFSHEHLVHPGCPRCQVTRGRCPGRSQWSLDSSLEESDKYYTSFH